MLHKNKQQLHVKKCQHSVYGGTYVVPNSETALKMKSREDAWWYQVPQSGKDLSAGTNCEFVPGGLIKVWPALKSPSSCPRLYFLKKNLFVLFYFCVTWTKIISTGARLNSSVSSCHYDLFNLGAWWTCNHEVPSSTCPHVLANISRCELPKAGKYQWGRATI